MKALWVILIAFWSTVSFAQGTSYGNALSIELSRLGTAGFTGLFANYDYMFKHSTRGFLDAKLGVGGYGGGPTWNGFSIRTNLTYNLGSKYHFFEIGISGAFVKENYENFPPQVPSGYFVGPVLGYRSISLKGLQFRFYLTPYLQVTGSPAFMSGGIGIGKAFGKRSP